MESPFLKWTFCRTPVTWALIETVEIAWTRPNVARSTATGAVVATPTRTGTGAAALALSASDFRVQEESNPALARISANAQQRPDSNAPQSDLLPIGSRGC